MKSVTNNPLRSYTEPTREIELSGERKKSWLQYISKASVTQKKATFTKVKRMKREVISGNGVPCTSIRDLSKGCFIYIFFKS